MLLIVAVLLPSPIGWRLLERPRNLSNLESGEGTHPMTATGQDTLGTRSTFDVGGKTYAYYSLAKAAAKLGDVDQLPFSMKVLLENLLRFEDGVTVTRDDIQALVDWQKDRALRPARSSIARRAC